MRKTDFSVSIVSHGHKNFIVSLLKDLAALGRSDFEVILTFNLPEELGINCDELPFPTIRIRNQAPKNFAENHNVAFAASKGKYFVVLNPDIRLLEDPFNTLLAHLQQYPNTVFAPLITNESGMLEDSARNFPTPLFLVKKLFAKIFKIRLNGDFVLVENALSKPDWVAGMFIVVPRGIYSKLHGLDERYRMYYEDVDFCARARLAGYQVVVNGYVKVIHQAQRDSHRKILYLIWHLRSALRFFTSNVYREVLLKRSSRFKWPE